jgi:hypothetical protein
MMLVNYGNPRLKKRTTKQISTLFRPRLIPTRYSLKKFSKLSDLKPQGNIHTKFVTNLTKNLTFHIVFK